MVLQDIWEIQVELDFVPLDVLQMAVVLLLSESEDLRSKAQAAYHHEEAHMEEYWHTAIGNRHTAVVLAPYEAAVLGPYEAVKPAQLHTDFVKAVVLVAEDS